jgi:predicted transcriptional regulator
LNVVEICGRRIRHGDQCRLGSEPRKIRDEAGRNWPVWVQSEVLREGVRLIRDRETRLAALDASIARGLADADAGRVTPAAKAFDRVESMLRAKAGTKRP